MADKPIISVRIVGDYFVGKTSLVLAYKNKKYLDTMESKYHDFYYQIKSPNHKIVVWDFPVTSEINFPMHVVIICFAVNSKLSYEMVKDSWIQNIRQEYPTAKIILVATKIDLRNDSTRKCYTLKDGLALKKVIKANAYMEVSSKGFINVDALFDITVLEVFYSINTETRRFPKFCTIL